MYNNSIATQLVLSVKGLKHSVLLISQNNLVAYVFLLYYFSKRKIKTYIIYTVRVAIAVK